MNLIKKDRSENRIEQALDYMKNGYMCSESIIMAYADRFGLDKETAVKISGGFAGGMALGKTCGAVCGAVMVIGLSYGAGLIRDQYARDLCFQMTQELFERLECRREITQCHKILGMNRIDAKDPEAKKRIREKGLCLDIVKDTAQILEELIA